MWNFTCLCSLVLCHQKQKPNLTFLLSPSWYCRIYNYINVINIFTFLHDLTAHSMFCKAYRSLFESSHVLHFVISKLLQLRPNASWCPQGHHYVHIGFLIISHMVQKFKCYRQTHKDMQTTWRCYKFGFLKAWIYIQPVILLLILPILSMCVRWFHLLNQLTDC